MDYNNALTGDSKHKKCTLGARNTHNHNNRGIKMRPSKIKKKKLKKERFTKFLVQNAT